MTSNNFTKPATGAMPAFSIDALSMDGFTRALRTYIDTSTEMQGRMLDLWTRRIGRDAAAIGKITQSKSVDAVLAAELEWAKGLYSDMADETRFMTERISSAMRATTPS